MKYIVNNSHDPEYNMAFEEYCFRNLPLENEEYVFLWSNSPTILLGKNQNTYQEINEKYINETLKKLDIKNIQDIKKIDTIPVYLREKINSDKDIMDYLKEKNKIEGDIKILENRIKIGSKIRFENEIYYLKGKPDENRLSVGYMKQLILSKSSYEVMRKIIKNIEKLNLENTEEKLSKILKNSKNSKELTTKEINIKINTVYEELYEKISEKEFGKIFSTITIPLKEYLAKSNLEILEDFNKLDIFSKIRVLEEIFKVITKLDNFSLKDIGGHKAITNARISINKILASEDFCIINQSPTGLFEKEVSLDK